MASDLYMTFGKMLYYLPVILSGIALIYKVRKDIDDGK